MEHKVIEQTIGQFIIRAVFAPEELHDGITVFVKHPEGDMVCCDHFGHDMHKAKEFVKRNSKGKMKFIWNDMIGSYELIAK
jgi:hypothetical protein